LKTAQGRRLDVTKQDEIDAVADLISKSGRGLYGLLTTPVSEPLAAYH